jgi:hypothetical protein
MDGEPETCLPAYICFRSRSCLFHELLSRERAKRLRRALPIPPRRRPAQHQSRSTLTKTENDLSKDSVTHPNVFMERILRESMATEDREDASNWTERALPG